MAPKIVDKKIKKIEIMQAAFAVFAQKGVANTKMIDIARAASIGKGTIYEYFTNKEDIFALGFQHFFDGFEQNLLQAVSQSENPQEQLTTLIRDSLTSFFDNHTDFAFIMLDFWAEGIRTKDDKVNNTINLKQIYSIYREMIVNIINNGIGKGLFREIDAVSLAALLISAMDGLILQWVMEPEIFDINRVVATLCDILFYGLKIK